MREEVTFEEISMQNPDEYMLIDIRNKSAFEYGHVSGSFNVPADKIPEEKFPQNKRLYILCNSGEVSFGVAKNLREKGYDAYNIKGGYLERVKNDIARIGGIDSEGLRRVETSIIKKFGKVLFRRFTKAVQTYDLIQPNDKIAVCISGGKDSFLMAKLFQELKKHHKFPFEILFLVMDPGYSPTNREIIEKNAKALNIPITVFETDIFENVFNIEKSPCYICARMRRGNLYSKAKELGCNKIALGHHYDDVIETILMGMLYGAQMQTMMPKVKSANFEGMELIRPMYMIREKDIKAWRDYNGLNFIQCACRFTENCADCSSENTSSKRQKVKELIRELAATDPEIEQNIFKSAENVNLSTVVAYKDKQGIRHFFADEY